MFSLTPKEKQMYNRVTSRSYPKTETVFHQEDGFIKKIEVVLINPNGEREAVDITDPDRLKY